MSTNKDKLVSYLSQDLAFQTTSRDEALAQLNKLDDVSDSFMLASSVFGVMKAKPSDLELFAEGWASSGFKKAWQDKSSGAAPVRSPAIAGHVLNSVEFKESFLALPQENAEVRESIIAAVLGEKSNRTLRLLLDHVRFTPSFTRELIEVNPAARNALYTPEVLAQIAELESKEVESHALLAWAAPYYEKELTVDDLIKDRTVVGTMVGEKLLPISEALRDAGLPISGNLKSTAYDAIVKNQFKDWSALNPEKGGLVYHAYDVETIISTGGFTTKKEVETKWHVLISVPAGFILPSIAA